VGNVRFSEGVWEEGEKHMLEVGRGRVRKGVWEREGTTLYIK
jgi:hypothetical protein